MKRTICIVTVLAVAVCLTAPVFTAGQQGGTELSEPLIWYVPGGSGFPYNEAEEKAVYDAFNAIVEPAIGTTVQINAQGKFGEYNETMPLMLASGEYMDIFWTATWSNNFLQNAYDGFLAGLDDLLEEYGQDILKDTREQLEATRINGEIRGVWSQQIAAYTKVFNVQMPLAEKYGWDLESVEVFEDLEPFLQDISANEKELIPFGVGWEPWKLMHPYYGFVNFGILTDILGARVEDEEITIINLIDTPEFKEWCELMHAWYKRGYIPQDGLTYTRDQWSQLQTQNRIAFGHHNTYNPQLADREFSGVLSRTFKLGEPVTYTTNIINTIQSISSQSKQKEKAMQLLNFLWTSEDAYNTLVWGLEGRHYERLDESHIKPIQDSGYYTNIPWMWGNTFISYLIEGQEEGLFDEVKELNRISRKAPSLGFNPDTDELKTLIASVSAVVDQFAVPVAGGYSDPETGIAKYLTALKQAGVDELIEKLQAQIEEWKAVNR
jgi:putative aldouronate transport system substrate-binding protein